MSFASDPFFQWIAQYAYQPEIVISLIFVLMLASGFGLPIPEEVTIISVGLITHMGSHPAHFPPPYEGARVLHGAEAAACMAAAVLLADFLVFWIGRVGGRRLMARPRFQKIFTGRVMERINYFVQNYGMFATFVFRFTPGLRFPAHLLLGMSDFKISRFLLIDGFAVLISVPTQVYLLYHYGEPILDALYRFKIYVLAIFCVMIIYLLVKKILSYRASKAG